nr:hypothetical protein orf238b [Schizostauron trachyderma]
MNKKTHLISGFLILITVFLVVYKNSNVKGFRRFLISLKLAVIITFSLVSPADAKDNGFLPGADAWSNKPSISRPLRRNYGLFDSKTTSSSGEPKKDPYSNSEINSDSNENRPKSTNLEHHFYSQEKTSDDETEDECPLSEESNRIKTGVTKDGTFVHVEASKMRDKSHHIDDFIDLKDLEGKFNIDYVKTLSYEDRLEYVRNKDNLPDELVYQMQDEVLEFFTDPETIQVPGFLGKYK